MDTRLVCEACGIRVTDAFGGDVGEKSALDGEQLRPRRGNVDGCRRAKSRLPGRMGRFVERHYGGRRVRADVEHDLETPVRLTLPDREEHAVPAGLAVPSREQERPGVPAEIACRRDVAVHRRPVGAHRRRRRGLVSKCDAHAERVRVERDAVFGEELVERVAKSLFRREANEGAFRVEQLLLGRRQLPGWCGEGQGCY